MSYDKSILEVVAWLGLRVTSMLQTVDRLKSDYPASIGNSPIIAEVIGTNLTF